MTTYHVTTLLYLGDPKGADEYERNDDIFFDMEDFPDAKQANDHKNEIVARFKEKGGVWRILYDPKSFKKPPSVSDEEWAGVTWEKSWPGSLPEGHTFVKGYKFTDLLINVACKTYDQYIRITSTES